MVASFTDPTAPFDATVSISYDYRVSRKAVCLLVVGMSSAKGTATHAFPIYRRIPRGMGSATAVFSVTGVSPSTEYQVTTALEGAARQGMHCTLTKLVATVDAQV
jgi:hypothetical protein